MTLLPDIPRGHTWSNEYREQCLVRDLLRRRVQGDTKGLATLKTAAWYPGIRSRLIEQWERGNRGGDWR